MSRRFRLTVVAIAMVALGGCLGDGESPYDPVWGPQCPPGYVDSCNEDGTNCSCKKS